MFRNTYKLPCSPQILAASSSTAYTYSSTFMSSYRGVRNHNQWQRGFSDRNSAGDGQFLPGDSRFQSVGDANGGHQFQPQPRYVPFYNPRQQSVPVNPQYRPHFNNNQQFRPPYAQPYYNPRQPPHFNSQYRGPFNQNPNQQFRPRPQKPLDYRNWEYAKPPPPPTSERFIIMSYNILADYLATTHRSKLYFHIPHHILDWDSRKRSIIFELGLWAADILCFQEVDRFQDLEQELKVRGYRGIWKMRTGDPVDGCAIFWRFSRFQLLHEESIEFNKHGLRDNVAQICVLELVNQNHDRSASALPSSSPGSNKVVICNIHVLFNPRRGEIKLGQVRLLLSKAHAVSKLWDDAPVVLCGDFNCTPKSPVYNFISEQKLNLSELHRDKLSGQASAEIHPSRPYIPNFSYCRPQPANYSAQAPTVVDGSSALFYGPMKKGHQGKEDARKEETEGILSIPITGLEESPSSPFNSVDQMKNGIHESLLINSIAEDIFPNLTETAHREDICTTSNALVSSSSEHSKLLNSEMGMSCNYSTDATIQSESVSTSNIDVPISDVVLDLNVENLSLDEPIRATESDILREDCTTFLSELHFTSGHFPSDVDSPSMKLSPVNVETTTYYDPSGWTPMEIETATGSSDCTLMEHPLKLRSTYTEIEDYSGTRDSNGEPLVTSYNRAFFGTVDYIWCSEGLQTAKVLAPIPRHAMQWTPGFPTKKWGSDHIALVSELAFTKNETI